jgi:hypothetical protein
MNEGKKSQDLTPSTLRVLTYYTQKYLEDIFTAYNLAPHERKSFQAVPTSNPIPLTRERLDHVLTRSDKYACFEKTDGVRYILLLTIGDDGGHRATMTNRAGNMFLVTVTAPRTMFHDHTVFDGELVLDTATSKLKFMVFDSPRIGNRSILAETASDRLNMCRVAIEAIQCVEFTIMTKSMVPFIEVEALMRASVDHATDGVILVDIEAPVETYFTKTTFKYKQHHTIDVMCAKDNHLTTRDGRDIFDLYNFPAFMWTRAMAVGYIVELGLELKADSRVHLCFVRKRSDKRYANHSRCIVETVALVHSALVL